MSEAKGSPLPRTEMDALLLGRLDELTVNEASTRSRSLLSILLSIVVLSLISSMIVAAIVIINPDITNFGRKHAPREAITLEEALLGEFSARNFDFTWLPADEGDQLLYEESRNIYLVTLPPVSSSDKPTQSAKTFQPNITTLVSNSSLLASIKYQGYKLSPSKRYLLIWTSRRKQFRHSFTARYFIYDIKLDLISLLSTQQELPASNFASQANSLATNVSSNNRPNQYEQLDTASYYFNADQLTNADLPLHDDQLARFQLASWYSAPRVNKSDANSNTDSLILVQNNDIYKLENVAELGASQADASRRTPQRLTFTGKPNELFNGVPDWLYEEEILGDTPAIQMSPNGQRLAYMSFNDSHVSTMPYSIYGDQIIPRVQRIRYPKAGQPNPRVSVRVIEAPAASTEARNDAPAEALLILPDELARQQHYIYRMNWLANDKLALTWANRQQNSSWVLVCAPPGDELGGGGGRSEWPCEKSLHLEAHGGWLDIGDDLFPLDDHHYLALVPKFEGADVGKFKHLAKVALPRVRQQQQQQQGQQPTQFVFLTGGRKDVLAINGVDAQRQLVYYTSTVVGAAGQRQLYAVSLEAPSASRAPLAGAQTQATGQQQQLQDKTDTPAAGARAAANALQAAKDKEHASVCVTCAHYPLECLYNFAKMSPSLQYYVFQCDGPDVPRTELRLTLPNLDSLQPSGRASASFAAPVSISASKAAINAFKASGTNQATGQASSSSQLIEEGRTSAGHANERRLRTTPTGAAEPGLVWTIEDNSELRARLQFGKAMPLTMRLQLPLANSSHKADVLLLLPPQLGPTGTFQRSTGATGEIQQQQQQQATSAAQYQTASRLHRRWTATEAGQTDSQQEERTSRQPYAYYTLETIHEYANQLATGQQYPMVVDVYAGPGSQKVDFRHHVYFGHYLASSRRTVYAMIDGRGSGFQGTKRLYELYKRFGTVEIEDQINVVQQLTSKLSFIDPSKVAIWGWSYGGYAAAMALAQSNQRAMQALKASGNSGAAKAVEVAKAPLVSINTLASALRAGSLQQAGGLNSLPPVHSLRGTFECAASVAPVTNWILYDTAYTERYMGSPWPNEQYDERRLGDHALASATRANFEAPPIATSALLVERRANQWSPLNETMSHSANHLLVQNNAAQQQTNSGDTHTKMATAARNATQDAQQQQQQQANSSADQMPAKVAQNSIFDLNARYRNSSLLEQIAKIGRKRFLLIHGTADDNVHFQQSIMLMKRLIQRNILFETRLYPDQDHGIANKADKLHLGSTLSNFFAECFDMPY